MASTAIVSAGHATAQSQAGTAPTGAAPAAMAFNIPAQPLSSALTAFARHTGIRLAYPASLAAGKSAPPLQGAFAAADALARLLAGSGLSYRFTGANAVTILASQASAPATGDAAGDGSVMLDTIDVSGKSTSGYLGTPDWVYQIPGSVAVISREAIQQAGTRNARDMLNLTAGVYSGEGQGSFPTVSPNIRGMQDSGRVVVSIDGARQNAQDGGRYGGSGLANFGGAFVDTAFVRAIDINKNPGATAGNAGALAGTVNFRTVGANDIIKPGRTWGTEADVTRGGNEHNFQGSALVAARIGEYLSLTAGFSQTRLGKYQPGQNGEAGGGTFGLTNREAWSSLLKLEGDFGEVKASLSWMHQQNDFAYTPSGTLDGYLNSFAARNDNAVADIAWNPVSPLVNVKSKFWLNNSQIDETRDARITSGITISPETYIDKRLTSFGGSLDNTSEFQTGLGSFALNYGAEAFRDQGDKSADSKAIAQNPLYASSYGAFSPAGNRDVASLFVNGRWEPTNWMNVSAGIRYDWTRLHGTAKYYSQLTTTTGSNRIIQGLDNYLNYMMVYVPATYTRLNTICSTGINPLTGLPVTAAQQTSACNSLTNSQNRLGEIINGTFYDQGVTYYGSTTTVTYPEHSLDIDRSYGALLPSMTVEFVVADWFKPYISYAHSFRPPTITEAFIGGGLAPSDAVGMNLAPNANLRPETSRTWELGFNVLHNGLFADNDRVRIKAAAFHREVEDFIVMGYIQTAQVSGWEYNSFVNAEGKTTLRGVELEGNYDAGAFWFGGSATSLRTEWPASTETFNNGSAVMTRCAQYGCGTTTSGDIFAVSGNVPPRFKATIDTGLRFFDQKLSVGGRINRVQPTFARLLDDQGNLIEVAEPYTTLDLYASLRIDDMATLRVAINNVTDKNYVPASANYLAPGRTVLVGLNLKLP